ncbi:MAG: cytochrome c biogenesis protein ResB, partial [Planctomycetota bacterium]
EVSDEEFLSEGGTARDRLLAAEAEVEIDGRWGKIHKKVTPYDPPIRYGDAGHGRPFYTFRIFKTETARDWYSVLTAIDHQGRVLKSHNVQVNSPLRYGGYRFFQARAGTTPEGLGMSGISVTANPGVNFMYLGYTVLTLGVCYVFFARPIITRRQRHRRREAA